VNGVEQLALAAVFPSADFDQSSAAQLVKLVSLDVELLVVRLIDDEQHRLVQVSQPLSHVVVQRHNSCPRIGDEDHDIGGIERRLDLLLDLLRQIIRVLNTDASGINELKESGIVLQEMRHSIASDAGLVIDDGNSAAGQPIQQARF